MRKSTLALLSLLLCGVAHADPATLVPDAVVSASAPIALGVSPVQVGDLTTPNYSYAHWLGARRDELPLLPYGSFVVTLVNHTGVPLSIRSDELSLVAAGNTMHPITDRATIEHRWLDDAYDDNMESLRGHLVVRDEQRDLHRSLDVMPSNVTVPANGSWEGYVVFDVGERSGDDWTHFVDKAKSVDVDLTLPGTTISTTFAAATSS